MFVAGKQEVTSVGVESEPMGNFTSRDRELERLPLEQHWQDNGIFFGSRRPI